MHYHANKHRQNVGLETWKWREVVTSETAHTKYKWPPYATEWNPSWKFSAYATEYIYALRDDTGIVLIIKASADFAASLLLLEVPTTLPPL